MLSTIFLNPELAIWAPLGTKYKIFSQQCSLVTYLSFSERSQTPAQFWVSSQQTTTQ